MKCPLCRSEVAMTAQICPHCRSNLHEYFSNRSETVHGLGDAMAPVIRWFFHTMMMFVPFAFIFSYIFEGKGLSDIWLWIGFFVCAVFAIIYRNKLPEF